MSLKDREFYERGFSVRVFRGDRHWAACGMSMAGSSRSFRSRFRWLALLKVCLWVYRCPPQHFMPAAREILSEAELEKWGGIPR